MLKRWLRMLMTSFFCWFKEGCRMQTDSGSDEEGRRRASCQELDSRKSLQCRAFLSFASLSIHSENFIPPRNDCQTFFITCKFVSKNISLLHRSEAQSKLIWTAKIYVSDNLLSEGFQRTVEMVGSILGSNLKW